MKMTKIMKKKKKKIYLLIKGLKNKKKQYKNKKKKYQNYQKN